MSRRDAFSELRATYESPIESDDQKGAPILPLQPLDLIPTANLKKKRSRQWEKDHRSETVTYRCIPRSLLADLLDLSETLGVPRDEVLRELLEYSLSRYRNGELNLIAYPKALRMTLFPKELPVPAEPPRGKATRQKWLSEAFPVPEKQPKSNGKKKASKDTEISSWQVRVTFRIPTLLKEEVRIVACDHCVAVGEVVWFFCHRRLESLFNRRLPSQSRSKIHRQDLISRGLKMKPYKSSWKSRFHFPRSETTSASMLTRRGQVADRTQTVPVTLPQTLTAHEVRKGLFQEKDGRLIVLKENGANQGIFLRFGSHGN